MNTQGWFPLGWSGLISLLSRELSRVFSSTTSWKASILPCSGFFIVQLSHPYMTTRKTIALTIWTFVGKVCWCRCGHSLEFFWYHLGGANGRKGPKLPSLKKRTLMLLRYVRSRSCMNYIQQNVLSLHQPLYSICDAVTNCSDLQPGK